MDAFPHRSLWAANLLLALTWPPESRMPHAPALRAHAAKHKTMVNKSWLKQEQHRMKFLFGTRAAGVDTRCRSALALPVYRPRPAQTAEAVITGIHTMRRPGTLRPLLPLWLPHDNGGPPPRWLPGCCFLPHLPSVFPLLNIYEAGTGSLQSESWSFLSHRQWQLSVLKAPSWALIYPPAGKRPRGAAVFWHQDLYKK